MKMCIILLLILISGNLIALPDYSKFYELTSTLNDAASDSVKNIIICGNAGTILISNDAGNTWEQKFVNSTNDFSDVEYLYDSTFIILNKKSNIYKTTDAGNNWSSIPIQATSEMTSLSFKNNIGIIACDDGSVFISRDAAETWVTQQISYTGFQKVLCTNDKFLVLNNNNTLFVSDKSDINWNQFQINSSMNKCKDIYEDSSGNYFLICDSLVVKLDKNFNTINELETHTACNAIDQIDSNNYYLYSFDYGLSISDKRLERYILSYIENQPMLRQDSIINDTNHIIYKGNINKTIKISDSILLTIGTRKSIFISKDCGFSWGMKSFYSLLDPYDSKNLPIVRYTDNNIFIGLPKFGLIYCSTNQGATWTYQKLSQIWYEAISNLYDMDFIDDSTGIAIGDASKGRFWFTGNSAESFEYTSVEQESFSNSKLAIADKNHYAFSKWYDSPGQALHTVNSSIIVTKDNLSSFNKTIFDSCYVFNLISINDSSYLATLNYFQYKNEQGDSVPTKQIIIRTKDYGNTWENI